MIQQDKLYDPQTRLLLNAIPEPTYTSMGVSLWRILLFGEKAWLPVCCGKIFANTAYYKVHWLTHHGAKLIYEQGERAGKMRATLYRIKVKPLADND